MKSLDCPYHNVLVDRTQYYGYLTELYFDLNPITKDRSALKDAEKKLARKLEQIKENGRRKYQVHGDGKGKKPKKKKEEIIVF